MLASSCLSGSPSPAWRCSRLAASSPTLSWTSTRCASSEARAGGWIHRATSAASSRCQRPALCKPHMAWRGSTSSRPRSAGFGFRRPCSRRLSPTTPARARTPTAWTSTPRFRCPPGSVRSRCKKARPSFCNNRTRCRASLVTLKMAGPDDLLNAPLRFLKSVGPKRAEDLSRVGLDRVEDLLCRLPFRYEDRGNFQPIASARAGQTISVAGELINCGVRLTRRRGFKLFQGVVRDPSGLLTVVWPNQPYLANALRPHRRVVLFGTVEQWRGRLQLTSPQFEVIDEDGTETIHTGRIVPIYERAGVVTPKMQRKLVHDVLEQLPDR